MGTPTLVIVSGSAGSGKSTLASALSGLVGCPVVSRDQLKEGMVLADPDFVASPGDPLTWRTYDTFFDVLRLLLEREVSVIAEAAFQHSLWTQGLARLTTPHLVRSVRCHVAAETAQERMMRRLVDEPLRAAHADREHLAAAAVFDELHLDGPTLDVQSTDDYHPDLAAIADFCRVH